MVDSKEKKVMGKEKFNQLAHCCGKWNKTIFTVSSGLKIKSRSLCYNQGSRKNRVNNRRHTLGSTTHCDRLFAVSKQWEAAAATEPENPAARLTPKGDKGPISSSDLSESNYYKKKGDINRCKILITGATKWGLDI